MIPLPTRLREGTEADQVSLLPECFDLVFPRPDARATSPEWMDWHSITDKADQMLAIGTNEACLGAAMMLIPERYKGDWILTGNRCAFAYDDLYWAEGNADFLGYGNTPALAIAAAVVASMESEHV